MHYKLVCKTNEEEEVVVYGSCWKGSGSGSGGLAGAVEDGRAQSEAESERGV